MPNVFFLGNWKEDAMPRVDPYKDQYNYDRFPDYEPSTGGAITFITMIAAIVLAAFLWATYAPQTAGRTNLNPPASTQPTPSTPTR